MNIIRRFHDMFYCPANAILVVAGDRLVGHFLERSYRNATHGIAGKENYVVDSVRTDILDGKHTFEEMALFISQDKDSRNNGGNMLNEKTHSGRFEMADLPAEVGKKVNMMQPGDVSEPFVMANPKTRREQVAIVKLVKRIDGHKADLADDYMIIKDMCEASEKEKIIHDWVVEKQKKVYVYIEEGWRDCDFKYDWLKKGK
jgi:peptidyl-prolyl cis-trans isomerase SurA